MSHLLALYMGSLILRSFGIAVIAGICSWKIRNVAIRHAVWVVVLGSILLMPAVDYLLPATWIPPRIQKIAAEQPVNFHIVSARAAGAPQLHAAATTVVVPPQSKSVDLWNVALALYALVAFAMFIRLALGYWKIRRLRRRSIAISSSVWREIPGLHRTRWRTPVLLDSEAVHVPMTLGLMRPAIILPADWKSWDDWKLRAVLLHESAHIHRNDWGIAVIAAAVKCAYWLNPVSWFLERRLSHLAEQASDDASLSRMQSAARYAEILLEFAAATQNGGRLTRGGIAMAHQRIQDRIERVLGKPQPGTGIVKFAGWALVMFIAVPVMYSAAALQVTTVPAKAPASTYAAEIERKPLPLVAVAAPQAEPTPAPTTLPLPQPQQNLLNPAADSRDSLQMELENRKSQQEYEQLKQKLAQAESQLGTVDFLRQEVEKAHLAMLHTEIAIREKEIARLHQLVNQPNPTQSDLERLRANQTALDRYRDDVATLNRQVDEKRRASPAPERTFTTSRNRIFVTGRVQRAGDFESDGPLTVLQALALAGGFQEYAKMDAISIIRMNGDSSILFQFNYSNVIKGVNTSQNIYLANGDVVVVP